MAVYDAYPGQHLSESKQSFLPTMFNQAAWGSFIFVASLPTLVWMSEGSLRAFVSFIPLSVTYVGSWVVGIAAMWACLAANNRQTAQTVLKPDIAYILIMPVLLLLDVLDSLARSIPLQGLSFFVVFGLLLIGVAAPSWWLEQVRRPKPFLSRNLARLPLWVMLGLLAMYGMPIGRSLAGTHPNAVGVAAIIGVVGCAIAARKLPIPELLVALALCLLVEARGSFVMISIFAAVWLGISFLAGSAGDRRNTKRFGVLAMAFVAMIAIFVLVLIDFLVPLVLDTFQLRDPVRGIGSGFTGRTELWDAPLSIAYAYPFSGSPGWYRGIVASGHNGFISLLSQFGLVPGGIIIGFVLWRTVRAVVASIRFPQDDVCRIVASFLVALLAFSIVEYVPMNFTAPYAIMTSILLLYPAGQVGRREASVNAHKRGIGRRY